MGKLKFRKLYEDAILPTRKFSSDAGWDLYSAVDVFVPARAQRIINTGVEVAGAWYTEPVMDSKKLEVEERDVEVPSYGYCYQIWSRSGLDSKRGIHVGAGIIDSGYRGELLVLLKNMSDEDYMVLKGDKVAQLVPVLLFPIESVEWTEDESEADRGNVGGILETQEEEKHE